MYTSRRISSLPCHLTPFSASWLGTQLAIRVGDSGTHLHRRLSLIALCSVSPSSLTASPLSVGWAKCQIQILLFPSLLSVQMPLNLQVISHSSHWLLHCLFSTPLMCQCLLSCVLPLHLLLTPLLHWHVSCVFPPHPQPHCPHLLCQSCPLSTCWQTCLGAPALLQILRTLCLTSSITLPWVIHSCQSIQLEPTFLMC